MIDENKIEEAKKAYIADKKILGIIAMNDLACGFKEGANWAINEFLKDLWHNGEEMPKKKNKHILMYYESYSVGERELDHDEYYDLCHTGKDGFDENTWEMFCNEAGWCSKWLYIDDLFPKKGVNHD